MGNKKGQKGVGFLVKGEWKYKVKEMRGINDHLAIIKTEVQKIVITCIRIYIYGLTINATDEKVKKFYDELENIIENTLL